MVLILVVSMNLEKTDLQLFNFQIPIRKHPYQDLTLGETDFNNKHGAMRSQIETYFAHFTSVFKFFHLRSSSRTSNLGMYSDQMKIAILLFNVKNFTSKHNVMPNEQNMAWIQPNYHPVEENNVQPDSERSQLQFEQSQEMSYVQQTFLNSLLDRNMENEVEEEIMEESDEIHRSETAQINLIARKHNLPKRVPNPNSNYSKKDFFS
jgi:hypothetical protein